MTQYSGVITSKLPKIGTSIFAVMTALAKEHDAINLSQGFPDFPISAPLIAKVNEYMLKGLNQYAPMQGVPELRKAISDMFVANHNAFYDPDKEINITAGATQAIYTAISAFVGKDDEVVIMEPAYDSYAPAVQINGGIVKYAQLQYPDFSINWDEFPRLISHRTKMIIINSPHNPSGSILQHEDMEKLNRILQHRDIIVLSDEVYEHLIFDKQQHQSVCRYPELANRSLLIGSFGKTFHATGWKVGFVLAAENLMKEFRKAHQFVVFAVNTPIQYALADFLGDEMQFTSISDLFQQKRDYFVKAIRKSKFKVIPSYGTYFQLLDYSSISDEKDMDFAVRLIKEHGIASVPVSAFYNQGDDHKVLRFCFAKEESTLDKAAKILCKI